MTAVKDYSGVDLSKALLLHDDKQDVMRANYGPLKHWYAALARREYEPATVLFHGDSLTEGKWANSKATTFVQSYRDSIQRMFRLGGTGYSSVGTYLTPWSFPVGGTASTSDGIARYTRTMTTTATAQMSFVGDRLWLMFTGSSGAGTAAISIDGVSYGTFATSNASVRTLKFDSGAIPSNPTFINPTGTGHTVVVSVSSGTISLDGGMVFFTDYGKGVQIWEAGHSGFLASDFTSTSLSHWTAIRSDLLAPDLVFIQFGINEETTAVSKATYKANLSTLIDNYRTALDPDPSIVLLGMWARGDGSFTDANWQPYRLAMRELAVEKNCAFFDMYDLAGWLGTTGTDVIGDLVTNGTVNVSSQTAYFRTVDIGTAISGTNIPGGTTIATTPTETTATLSASATGSGTNPATFTARKDIEKLTQDLIHPGDRGHQWIADGLQRQTAGMPKLSNIPQGIFDAAGDIIIALNADVAVRLPVGQPGQVLKSIPNQPGGLGYAAPNSHERLQQLQVRPAGTAFDIVGFSAANPTVVTPGAAIANADAADGIWANVTTTTVANIDASFASTFNLCRSAWLPEASFRIKTGGIALLQLSIGLFSASPLTAADPAIHGAGFRYNTTSDGTAFWRTWSNDGTSTGTVTTTVIAIAATTAYDMRIEFRGTYGTDATEIRFYINDFLAARHTTNLPISATNNLGMFAGVRTLTTASKIIGLSRWTLVHK